MLQLFSCACITGCTGAKFPIIAQLCGAQALLRKILISGVESEECCNVRVRELVKYQVQLVKTFLL